MVKLITKHCVTYTHRYGRYTETFSLKNSLKMFSTKFENTLKETAHSLLDHLFVAPEDML